MVRRRDKDLAALRALAGRSAGLLKTHLEDPLFEPVFKAASRYLAGRVLRAKVVRAYPVKLHGRKTLGEDMRRWADEVVKGTADYFLTALRTAAARVSSESEAGPRTGRNKQTEGLTRQ